MKSIIAQEFIYLDHCGSTPMFPEVVEHLQNLLHEPLFGNPSAKHHRAGEKADELITQARQNVAAALKVPAPQVFFTAGATESNNIVLHGFCRRYQARKPVILYGATEHKSVHETSKQCALWYQVEAAEIRVDASGKLDCQHLETLLQQYEGRPILVAVMWCNNEIPARHPMEDVSALCSKYKAYLHCDATQGLAREKIDLQKIQLGSLAGSFHKSYGPKGVGLLVLTDNSLNPRLQPLLVGGDQEGALRPGTMNTLSISAAALSLQIHQSRLAELLTHLKACEQVFLRAMQEIEGFHQTVTQDPHCPGIVSFWFDKTNAQDLLEDIGQKVCLNRGASCLGNGGERYSHVPIALGYPVEIAANVLRASFGWGCSLEQVQEAALLVTEEIRKLKHKS